MKIQQCEKNGVSGWQYGDEGRCFVGNEAFQKAKREEQRARAAEFKENPAELPHEKAARLELEYASSVQKVKGQSKKDAVRKHEAIELEKKLKNTKN